ncbi:hypothetical protein D3C84_601130 [compost metagenome]
MAAGSADARQHGDDPRLHQHQRRLAGDHGRLRYRSAAGAMAVHRFPRLHDRRPPARRLVPGAAGSAAHRAVRPRPVRPGLAPRPGDHRGLATDRPAHPHGRLRWHHPAPGHGADLPCLLRRREGYGPGHLRSGRHACADPGADHRRLPDRPLRLGRGVLAAAAALSARADRRPVADAQRPRSQDAGSRPAGVRPAQRGAVRPARRPRRSPALRLAGPQRLASGAARPGLRRRLPAA